MIVVIANISTNLYRRICDIVGYALCSASRFKQKALPI